MIILPGALDYIVWAVTQDQIFSGFPQNGYIFIGGFPLVMWCIFLVGGYLTLRFCSLLVYVSPAIFGYFSTLLTGDLPKNFEIYAGYIHDLRQYISFLLFMIILAIAYQIILQPNLHRDNVPVEIDGRVIEKKVKIFRCFLLIFIIHSHGYLLYFA